MLCSLPSVAAVTFLQTNLWSSINYPLQAAFTYAGLAECSTVVTPVGSPAGLDIYRYDQGLFLFLQYTLYCWMSSPENVTSESMTHAGKNIQLSPAVTFFFSPYICCELTWNRNEFRLFFFFFNRTHNTLERKITTIWSWTQQVLHGLILFNLEPKSQRYEEGKVGPVILPCTNKALRPHVIAIYPPKPMSASDQKFRPNKVAAPEVKLH